MWLAGVTVGSLFLSAAGQPGAEKARSKDRIEIFTEVTQHNFEDGLNLQGKTVRPGIDDFIEYPRPTFNPLINLRKDFTPEMRQSVDEVK